MMRFWGLGPGPWVPGPLVLVIAMDVFHDGIKVWTKVPGSQAL